MDRPCRICVFVGCLLCLVAAGCMELPYCFPEINYAPGVDAKCKADEVFAFRVDVTQKTAITEGTEAVSGKILEFEQLTRVRPAADGTTPSQLGFTFASGWRYVGFYNFTSASTEHGVTMRFYRRGYNTIGMKPGGGMRELDWSKAIDFDSQVRAVDELMHGDGTQRAAKITLKQVLEPGTKSAAQREALLFGAKEYERLATELTERSEQKARRDLLAEAQHLRALSDGK